MENHSFYFAGNINGIRKKLVVNAPIENGGVYTNKFCLKHLSQVV